jgi:hypothetical protein
MALTDVAYERSPRRGRSVARVVEFASAHADALAVAALCAIVVVAAFVSWRAWGDLSSDAGYDYAAAQRVIGGEVPYRDFQYFYGPLGVGFAAFAFLLGGTSLSTSIAVGLAVAGLAVLATYAMTRTVASPPVAAAAGGMVIGPAFSATNTSYVIPHTYSATLAVLLTIGLVLAVWRWVTAASSGAAWLSGVALGLLTLTRPEFVLAGIVSLAAVLLVRWRGGQPVRRDVLRLALPAIVIPGLVYGVFALLTSPGDLVFENLWPREQLAAGGDEILRLMAPLTLDSVRDLVRFALLYGVVCAAMVAGGEVIRRTGRKPELALVSLGGALGALVVLLRPETARNALNVAYEWLPLGAPVAAAALIVLALRRRRATPAAQLDILVACVLTVLAVKTYAVFNPLGPEATYAAYAVPFAAFFLVRLHTGPLARRFHAGALGASWLAFLAVAGTGLLLWDASSEHGVRGPGGELGAPATERAVYQQAVTWIDRNVAPGQTVLLAPQLTMLGVLADRDQPALRPLQLLPIALPKAAEQRQAIATLETSPPRAVVIDRQTYPEYGHTSFGGTFDTVIDAWVQRNYRRAAVFTAAGMRLEGWLPR